MEERFRRITHKGETIVLLDLSNLQDGKEIISLLKMRTTLQRPHCLHVDLTNTHFSRAIAKEAKENAKAVRPVLKGFAAVGTGGMVGMLAGALGRFSGMNIGTFGTRQEAMDWLAKQ